MKLINKDVLVTDPCYLIRDDNVWTDFINGEYDLKLIGVEGECTNTGFGDWICHMYCTKVTDVWEHVKKVMKSQVIPKRDNSLGTFTADAGLVCIINLSDAPDNIKDEAKKLQKECPHCAVLLKDFTGELMLKRDRNGYTHVIGDNVYSILG